jgi:hypothetical protein
MAACWRQWISFRIVVPLSSGRADWRRNGRLHLLHALEPLDESGLRAKGLDGAAIKQRREEMRAIAENLLANLSAGLQG